MKAVRYHQHGSPDVLCYEDAPDPVLAAGEALVRVRACALNHLDLWARRGLPHVRIAMPHIGGSDIAGEVVDAAAQDVAIGRRVMLRLDGAAGDARRASGDATTNARATRSSATPTMTAAAPSW